MDMYVMVVGLNFRTAPVEIREKFAFSDESLGLALRNLKNTKSVLEAVIVTTCNRTEIYAVTDQLNTCEYFIKKFLSEWFSIPKEEFAPFLYVKSDIDATEHLFSVISGLDSMILGETQILGQIRQAFFNAQKYGATGTIFNTLFRQAITFAKKVHSQTGIGENAVSVSYAAIELAKKIFDRLENKRVLLIGAGETSELTALHLHTQGVKQIMVVNRTFEKAKHLADSFNGQAYPMDQLEEALFEADIVISSTGSDTAIITKPLAVDIMEKRNHKPLILIDIAVPRDIESTVIELDNIYLYDIDDLKHIVDANLKERQKISIEVNRWIDQEVYLFYQWVNQLGVIPLITAIREKSFAIQEDTMRSIGNKLPHLSEKDMKIINKHTKSIVNQMLKNPIMRLKENATEPDAKEMNKYFKKIFAIEEEAIKLNPIYESVEKESKKMPVNLQKQITR